MMHHGLDSKERYEGEKVSGAGTQSCAWRNLPWSSPTQVDTIDYISDVQIGKSSGNSSQSELMDDFGTPPEMFCDWPIRKIPNFVIPRLADLGLLQFGCTTY
jgi:hypothetical protein